MEAKQSRQVALLKSALYRLTSTSAEQLPSAIAHISSTLIDCKELISSDKQSAKDGANSATLQKLKTLVTSYVTSKVSEKRWCGVVLIKTLVDVGSTPILQSSSPWIQGLLAIIRRNEPSSVVKKFAVITLTRIFLLTQDHPTLIRELTTPSLPQFITHSLNLAFPKSPTAVRPSNALTITILDSFSELLPMHPSMFRTFVPQFQSGLALLLVPSSTTSDSLSKSAQSLYTLLSITAPKNGSSDEWNKTLGLVISATHQSLDQILRAVVEDWKSDTGWQRAEMSQESFSKEPQCSASSSVPLPSWEGLYPGCEHVKALLSLVDAFLHSYTPMPVSVPIGRIADLIRRLCDVAAPSVKPIHRIRNEVSREEREALYSQLPSIHVATLQLIGGLCDRFDKLILPLCPLLIEQISVVFRHESFNEGVRGQSYLVTARLIQLSGRGYSKEQAKTLTRLLRKSCEDAVQAETATDQHSTANGMSSGSVLAPTKSNSRRPIMNTKPRISLSALAFVKACLANIPAQNIPLTQRTVADRTAILSQDSQTMMASILNPPASLGGDRNPRNSILPFLAQAHPALLEVEGLLRPRMPVIPVAANLAPQPTGTSDQRETVASGVVEWSASSSGGEDEDEEMAGDDDAAPGSHGADEFVSPFAPPPRTQPPQPQSSLLKRSLSSDRLQQRKRPKNADKNSEQVVSPVDEVPAPRGTADTSATAAASNSATKPPAVPGHSSDSSEIHRRRVAEDGADESAPAGRVGDAVETSTQLLVTSQTSPQLRPPAESKEGSDNDDSDIGDQIPQLHFASSSDEEDA